ncbi:MAG: hypothetical protein L0Z50_20325 [Verrucomicrobiales bacterium]|nr:hypothetical protein [Verrucomicrobiales bacterium]
MTTKWNFITIVSGLPRSGTSMMMRMLEAGGMPVLTDSVRKADEDNPRGYYEFERVKQLKTDSSWLAEAEGMAVKMVYRLLYLLPDSHAYRVVFMSRKLEEVIASQEVMLARHQRQGGPLNPEQLANAFQTELERLHTWLGGQNHIRVLSLTYHDVLSRPERAVAEIDEFLGPGLNRIEMARVAEPALYRQRK